MKKYLLTTLIFMGFMHLSAQDYQNICSPGKTLFYKGSAIKVFRCDSILPLGNADTMYVSFAAVRDTAGACMDVTGGSVLGSRIIKHHDGFFTFYNYRHDTISILTRAQINDTWKLVRLSGTDYLEAKISAIVADSVAGLIDSVKVITIRARNTAGQTIPHLFNAKEFRLSKYYGFSKLTDLFMLPVDTATCVLAGKSQPKVGLQDLTVQDIYDFNIGDEFHFSDFHYVNDLPYIYYDAKEIWTILEKTTFPGSDSVHYLVNKCVISKMTVEGTDRYSTSDTPSVVSYNFLQLSALPKYSKCPDEFDLAYSYTGYSAKHACGASKFNGRTLRQYDPYNWRNLNGCTQFNNVWISTIEYAQGLGLTLDKSYTTAAMGFVQTRKLVYYKKGQETWGTSLASDCQHLFPYLETDSDTVDLTSSALSRDTIMIMANYEWQLLGMIPAWLSVDSLKGSGNGRIIFGAKQANNDTLARMAVFALWSQLAPDITLRVIQQGRPTGISEQNRQSIVVFPNPTTGRVNFRSEDEVEFVKVFDAYGVLLQTVSVHERESVLDLSGFGKGLFILGFETAKQEINLKVTVL